ncbi:hypothetical protein E1292_35045 [Nonomuraea deserti]|uniref:Uncharacterized protein n=1 Tax=Nonomuraea deserti TaxID=1848322 RepID=A0A4R4V0M8_9ACTN|nr:hypothetical protein [Nonomuraea deserti]TDC98527.1 hypothetical protein E1292_35045 [Nonomuraea deserti]
MMLLCVAAVTSCAAAGPANLEEAGERLSADAGRLLDAAGLDVSQAEEIDDDVCLPGQARRLLRAESDAAGASTGLLDRLGEMGYSKIADDVDLRDDDADVSVLRNPETGLTFELTVLAGEPPVVRIVGKTTCYAAE